MEEATQEGNKRKRTWKRTTAEEREEPRKRKTKWRRTLRWNHVIVERFNWSGARSTPRWREDEINGEEGGLPRGSIGRKDQDWDDWRGEGRANGASLGLQRGLDDREIVREVEDRNRPLRGRALFLPHQ